MKKILIMFVMFTSFSMFAQAAEAKRFGGGKSFGYSKKMPPKQHGQKPVAQQPPKTALAASGAKSGASKWLGPLAGLAAGGLLAAMIFGDGFDGIQMLDILLFGLIAFILFKLFTRKKRQSNEQYAGHHQPNYEEETAEQNYQSRATHSPQTTTNYAQSGSMIGSAVSDNAQPVSSLPAWFDEASFVQNSKQHFIAIQKAWDAADTTEIASYCSPELFTALSTEMEGMQSGDNHTEIDELNVELLEAVIDGKYLVISVRYAGYIIEEKGADAHAFSEIWHIRRLGIGEGNWQISGIQHL